MSSTLAEKHQHHSLNKNFFFHQNFSIRQPVWSKVKLDRIVTSGQHSASVSACWRRGLRDLLNEDVGKTFADSVSSLFRALQECTVDAEVERWLFKAVAVLSAARVSGWKRLSVANNGKKVALWWNREEKDAIQAEKVAYEAWLCERRRIFFAFAARWGAKIPSPHSEKLLNGFQLLANQPASLRQKIPCC